LAPIEESEDAIKAREEKRAWLAAHDYAVTEVKADEVERDLARVLDSLSGVITGPPRSGETR
jgi:very-short-patch-repair endonuclease